MVELLNETSHDLVEHGLLPADAELEPLVSGFTYTEGPIWDEAGERLLFHDIPADIRYSWRESTGAVVELTPTAFSNGMTFDGRGRLLICRAGTSEVVRLDASGELAVIASHFEGKELNSPNDIVVRANQDIYFTDPGYGRIPVYGIDRPQQLTCQGIYRIVSETGELELVSDSLTQPNGLAFSPDQAVLCVSDSETGKVHAFDMDVDGTVRRERVFFDGAGVPLPFQAAVEDHMPSGYLDGMTCDVHGNVYQTGNGGIWVISPEGAALGVLRLPEDVANLTWGPPDYRALYLACRSTIYRVQTLVTGAVVRP